MKENNQPVNGNRQVEIILYDSLTVGAPHSTGAQGVYVSTGLFKSTFTVPGDVDLSTGEWYLELVVEGVTMSPRERLSSVPYSLYSTTAAYAVHSASASYANRLAAPADAAAVISSSHVYLVDGSSLTVSGVVSAFRFYGDGSGLTGVTGASGTDATKVLKTGDTMTGQLTLSGSTLTVDGALGIWTARAALADNVSVSSETDSALGGGLRISSNVYIVGFASATRYFGDGSGLTNVAGASPAGSSLASGNIWVGDGFNAAAPAVMSGDATLGNTGVLTLKNTGMPGTYRAVTTDAHGRVTAGANPTTFAGYGLSDTSANLADAVTDETGTGALVFSNDPSFTGIYSVGVSTFAAGIYAVGTSTFTAGGTAVTDMATIWRDSGGTIVSSVSATGVMMAANFIGNGSGLSGVAASQVLAAGVQAGLLGASVIASSVAVGSVFDEAIASLSASKLTGAIPAVRVDLSTVAAAFADVRVDTTSIQSSLSDVIESTGGIQSQVDGKVALAGDTMLGRLTAPDYTATYGITAASVSLTYGIKAGTGVFTAAGENQYSVAASSGISALLFNLGHNITLSSMTAAVAGGGLTVSTNVYLVGFSSAARYYGDGSSLTGVTASQVSAAGVQAGLLGASVIASSIAAGSVHDSAIVTGISASKLIGALPAISGAALIDIPGDGLGAHVATTTLQMGAFGVNTSSAVSAGVFQINGSTVLAVLPGTDSLRVGVDAGRMNYAAGNSFIGARAGYSNTSGVENTFVGWKAGYTNTGSYNSMLGSSAGSANSTGSGNIFVGYMSGRLNTSGSNNAFLGNNTGRNTATGSANTLLGSGAGEGNSTTSFSSNTLVGYQAGSVLTSGSDNIFLGWQAGFGVTTGTGNIVIGYGKDTAAPNANNQLNIGGVLYGDLAAKTIGLSRQVPQAALDVVSTGTTAGQMAQIWRGSDGVIQGSMSATGVMMASKFIGDGSLLTNVAGASPDGASLTSGNIWVGNSSNLAQARAMSGDATLSNTGVLTLKNTGTSGTYRSVTTDAQGRVTAGTNPTTFAGYGLSDTSANLAAAVTDETGTGALVFSNDPSFTGIYSAGVSTFAAGIYSVGTSTFTAGGTAVTDMATIWRDSGGTIVSSVSATGVMMAASFIGDGSGLSGVAASQVPAAGVQAGLLGASVIASSVAVGSVFDEAIASLSAAKLTGAIPAALVDLSTVAAAFADVQIDTTSIHSSLSDVIESTGLIQSQVAGRIARVGDTMTGPLEIQSSSLTLTGAGAELIVGNSLHVSSYGVTGIGDISSVILDTDTAVHVVAQLAGAGPGGRIAVFGDARSSGGADADVLVGGNFEASAAGSDVLNYFVGARAKVRRESAGVGTIVNAIGLMVDELDNENAAGMITNTYGVYIGTQTAGNQENTPYALYSEDRNARTYFAGMVGISSTAPQYQLVVVSTGAGESGGIMSVSSGAAGIFWVAVDGAHATKFYGDGSALTGVTAPGAVSRIGDTMTGQLTIAGSSLTVTGGIGADTLYLGAPETRSTFTAAGNIYLAGGSSITLTGAGAQIFLPNAPVLDADAVNKLYVDTRIGLGGAWTRNDAIAAVRLSTGIDNVGIGIAVPKAKLHISSSANINDELFLVSTGAVDSSQYVFGITAAGDAGADAGLKGNLTVGLTYAESPGPVNGIAVEGAVSVGSLAPDADTKMQIVGEDGAGKFVVKFYSGNKLVGGMRQK